ncbi:hypothetical protein R6Q59_017607 [Mikania micrantha]
MEPLAHQLPIPRKNPTQTPAQRHGDKGPTIVTIIKTTRIQANIIKVFKSSRKKKKNKNRLGRPGKKPIGKKAPAKRWSDEEEVALARAWLTISENPDVGNAQKRDGFYKKVTEHFHHLVKDRSRTVDQIYSKWNDMNASMKKWNGFYQQCSMNRKSGEGDEQVLKTVMKNYKILVKSKGFDHIQAWDVVRDSLLWCDIPPVGCDSQSTTKRPKPNESMGGANPHIDINLDDDEDININLIVMAHAFIMNRIGQ